MKDLRKAILEENNLPVQGGAKGVKLPYKKKNYYLFVLAAIAVVTVLLIVLL